MYFPRSGDTLARFDCRRLQRNDAALAKPCRFRQPPGIMRLDVLVEATNKLLRVDRPSASDLREMLIVGCKELRILISDPAFFTDLRAGPGQSPSIDPDVVATFNDLSRFAGFLEEEKKVLLEAGLKADAVTELLKYAAALRPLLSKRSAVDSEALRIALVKLANEVCNLAELTEPSESQQFRKVARPVLRRVALTIGGATIISANVAAAIKLGQVYANASISVGTGMIKHGLFEG